MEREPCDKSHSIEKQPALKTKLTCSCSKWLSPLSTRPFVEDGSRKCERVPETSVDQSIGIRFNLNGNTGAVNCFIK